MSDLSGCGEGMWWRAVVNTVVNLWLAYNLGMFLSNCIAIGFSIVAQLLVAVSHTS
jgi:hypothetical protein